MHMEFLLTASGIDVEKGDLLKASNLLDFRLIVVDLPCDSRKLSKDASTALVSNKKSHHGTISILLSQP